MRAAAYPCRVAVRSRRALSLARPMSAAAGQGQAALALESLSWKQVGVPEHMLGKLPKIGVENPTPVQASAIVSEGPSRQE